MYGFMPKMLDHINRVRDDNRISNLRITTSSINNKNAGIRSNNTSGTTGVRLNKSDQKWYACIAHHGKKKHLGSYSNIEDAIAIRREWEKKLGYLTP